MMKLEYRDGLLFTAIEIDFGLIDQSGEINGLIGLDILMEVGAIIDLNELNIEVKSI